MFSVFEDERNILITRDREQKPREFCTSRSCSNNSYLSLASPYILVTFQQLPPFTQTNVKAYRFCHFFGTSFPCERSCVTENLNKFVCFFPPLISLMSIQFSDLAEDSNRVEVKICLHCKSNGFSGISQLTSLLCLQPMRSTAGV